MCSPAIGRQGRARPDQALADVAMMWGVRPCLGWALALVEGIAGAAGFASPQAA